MSDNRGTKEGPKAGLLSSVKDWDVKVTRAMAVCASRESSYGQWRPLMRFLEYSAHGVPWLIGNVAAILATHKLDYHQIFLNLFYGGSLDIF